MTAVRAMAVFTGATGLPEDRCVNVFHMVGVGTYASDQALVAAAVLEFYTTQGVQGEKIAAYLSPWLKRDWEIRCYDMSLAPHERAPTIHPQVMAASAGPDGLAEEVAVCLSYTSEPPITPSKRGRIYLGPLNNVAVLPATTSTNAKPRTQFVNDLCVAATRLAENGPELTWAVRSLKGGEHYVPITRGYVDNACDTQRRRGPKTSGRTAWSLSI